MEENTQEEHPKRQWIVQKTTARPRKDLTVGVKYKYATTY